ncbi:basic salivary proline-rich protein 4-like isoform X2 [Haliaeetus albicilla]|uniref:basic salivary proline-rich protein 4-like isoform X2 n=1 Tax=Haliaeetus albicilla TaxID=8969 RepID=UPI0037E79C04
MVAILKERITNCGLSPAGGRRGGFARPGGAKTRLRRAAGGCSQPRRPELGREGLSSRPPGRGHRPAPGLPRGRGRVCRTWAASLGEGGGRQRGRKPPARPRRGEPRSRGRAAAAPQLRWGERRRRGAGGGERHGRGQPAGPGTARHGLGGPVRREAACGPPAGWRGTRSSSSSPPPPPAAIQRATAAVSTGTPRSRLSLPEPACAPGRGRPILPVPAGARSPSPPGKGGGGGPCVGNRLLGATRGGGRRGDKHWQGGGRGMGGNVPANHPCPPPCPGHPPFTAPPPALLGSLYGNHELARWKNLPFPRRVAPECVLNFRAKSLVLVN